MKELLYEIIFSIWCDCGGKTGEQKEISRAIENIGNLFQADNKNRLFIEADIMEAVCASEKNAFIDGLRMGIGIMTGRLFYDELPDRR